MDGSNTFVGPIKPAAVEREMHLVMTGRVASHTIGLNGATQNIDVIEIGTSTIDKAISAAGRDIDNIGMVSMDSLFCPYVIGMNWEDHSSLPHWEEPAISGVVTATNLNPFNPAMAMTSATVFYNTGPNLAIYNSVETLGEGDFCQFKNVNENELRLNSVKGVGLKTPIILTGWGYDTNSKPVPADSSNPDVFASGAFRDPSLWKSGPLDVRWDDNRKVWTPPSLNVTTIRFRVVGSDPSSFTVLGFVMAWDGDQGFNRYDIQDDVNGEGQEPLGVVEVCDPMGCFFDEPADELFNRTGWARRMYSEDASACRSSYPPYPTLWEVFSLCCKRRTCYFT
jgi:hypothetical protein